jgi:hypothetical protein
LYDSSILALYVLRRTGKTMYQYTIIHLVKTIFYIYKLIEIEQSTEWIQSHYPFKGNYLSPLTWRVNIICMMMLSHRGIIIRVFIILYSFFISLPTTLVSPNFLSDFRRAQVVVCSVLSVKVKQSTRPWIGYAKHPRNRFCLVKKCFIMALDSHYILSCN